MFGHQIDRHCQFTSLMLLLAIFLAACDSQASQVESTPAISSEVTTPSPPTDTPAPTLTDEPYREPTTTPTAEPIATPEPTPMPEWDFEENGPFPSVTSQNGEMTVNEDGSVIFTFTVGEKNSPVFGQEFTHTVPAFGDEAIDISGAPAGPLLLQAEPLEDREPMIGSNYTPLLKMVNALGETMAFYDYTSGVWKNTYENLYTGLGQQEVEAWMPQELGVIDIYIKAFEGFEGDFTFISLIGRPERLFTQELFFNGKNSKTITWLELIYNSDGNSIFIPVFDSDAPVMSGIDVIRESDGIDIISTPRILDGNTAIDKDFARVIELLKGTSRVNIATALQPETYIEKAYKEADWRLELPVNYQGGPRHDLLRSTLEVDDDIRLLQQQLATEWLNGQWGSWNEVKFGYTALGIFQPTN